MQGDIIDRLTNRSLYQKITAQNFEANRNNHLPKHQRSAVSQSYKGAQKTFSKCNALNQASQVGWSVLDADMRRIGGTSQSVRNRTAGCTNDPTMYRNSVFNSRGNTQSMLPGENLQEYFYKDHNNQVKQKAMDNLNNMYKISNAVNKENP
jgi:hypothetical protein